MEGLMQVDVGSGTLSFVRMFYGAPSEYLWEDDFGQVHTIAQGEGGEQGDAILFALGQHGSKFMFAYSRRPPRSIVAHARIAIHVGKTKVWNASGTRPEICTLLERMARETDRTARVWRGSEVPEDEQGMKVLGHPQYLRIFLSQRSEKHEVLLRRIPQLDDVQSAWLLLAHCAAARANYSLRCEEPQDVEPFARTPDIYMRQCLSQILQVNLEEADQETQDSVTVPFSLEGSTDEQRAACLGQLGRLLGHDQ